MKSKYEDKNGVIRVNRNKVEIDLSSQKIYTIYGSSGPRFSFNASSQKDAESKLFKWLRYHSMTDISDKFSVKETPNSERELHNEWVS